MLHHTRFSKKTYTVIIIILLMEVHENLYVHSFPEKKSPEIKHIGRTAFFTRYLTVPKYKTRVWTACQFGIIIKKTTTSSVRVSKYIDAYIYIIQRYTLHPCNYCILRVSTAFILELFHFVIFLLYIIALRLSKKTCLGFRSS